MRSLLAAADDDDVDEDEDVQDEALFDSNSNTLKRILHSFVRWNRNSKFFTFFVSLRLVARRLVGRRLAVRNKQRRVRSRCFRVRFGTRRRFSFSTLVRVVRNGLGEKANLFSIVVHQLFAIGG